MSNIVEAQSLSSIIGIAECPPRLSERATIPLQPPLTLYIARVPGRRDVFLTPLKPREKTVTAEDVESSLYYIHFNDADDIDLMLDDGKSDANVIDSARTRTNNTSRAPPLPARPTQHNDLKPALPPRPSVVSRKPLLRDNTNERSEEPRQAQPALPPRPPPHRILPGARSGAQDEVHEHSWRSSRSIDNPYMLPTPSMVFEQEALSGSLTLIRRNPGTSEQWNVARIRDPPVHEISSTKINTALADRRIKKSGAPLYLDILNPGYAAFSASSSSTIDSPLEHDDIVLRRRLYLPGSKTADHSYVTSSRSSMDASSMASSLRKSIDRDAPHVDWRNKGYSFTSPWDGQCEFNTSTSGRSLKCRHHLRNGQIAEEVSELRFNLPVSSLGASDTLSSNGDKRRSILNPLQNKLQESIRKRDSATILQHAEDDSDNESIDRMDLSLGREKAGGGLGGKRVKLGKLIIHPEGMLMLDLLVAANVGLWWRAWEKAGR